ncbi:hypothetical protein PMAYCL1PPCAC_15056, partial [Pristionchus mayeri]
LFSMANQKLTLFTKWTSSCSWRVRCALHYKQIKYETQPVNLLDLNNENGRKLLKLNPASRVPMLIHGERVLTESMAIMEYLEENFDGPRLLPADSYARAQSRAIALHIACGIQPLQNMRVTRKVSQQHGPEASKEWAKYWTHLGLKELEGMVSKTAGTYAVGDAVSIADTCIPSIMMKGRSWKVDVAEFPTLLRIDKNLAALESFQAAHPDRQPEAAKQ